MIQEKPSVAVTEKSLVISRVPKKFWRADASEFKDENRMRVAKLIPKLRNWLLDGSLLVFSGPVSTGKTVFACIMIRAALEYGATCLYVREQEIGDSWNHKGFVREHPEHTLGSWVGEVDLLVVDDAFPYMDKTTANKLYCRRLDYIVRDRCENGKMTILAGRNPIIYMGDKETCLTVAKYGLIEYFLETYAFQDGTLPTKREYKALGSESSYKEKMPTEATFNPYMAGEEEDDE